MEHADQSRFPRSAAISLVTLFAAAVACTSVQAAVMHSDVSIQTYTDFGQNMGRYSTTTNALLDYIRATEGGVYIYYTGGQESYRLDHGLIDFESTADIGAYNAIGHNFIATVAHNGVQNPTFSGRVVGDANAIHYATIEYRYDYTLSPEKNVFSLRPAVDYKIARTSKLITDVTGSTVYSGSTTASDLANQMLYRAGSGTQQLASYDGENTYLLGAYGYIIGGIMQIQGASDNTDDSLDYRDITDDSFSVSWNNYDWSSDAITANNPLPNTILGGDSGSPGWIWNEATQQYEYLAAGQSGNGVLSISRGATQWTTETMESYNKHVALTDAVGVITINAVTDTRADETVSCDIQGVSATPTYGTVTDANGTVLTDFVGVKSGLSTWNSLTAIKDLQNWYAYGNEYLNTNTATSDTAVSYADLFLTENLVFTAAQAQTTVDVGADVDLGIGYVQFSAGELSSAEFTLQSTGNHQLNSAGYIVDAGVDLYVTLTNTDTDYMREWRKVGDGNLHIAGTGNNEIFLNLGGNGKTYLEQSGGYAAYNVIANNGATVVVGDVNQIARDFTFGAGGGVLDMNGNSMEWKLNNTDVSATGFTINALTEEAVITNTAGTAVTLTYTEGGDTTFVGSFKDTENGALKVVYDGGAEASWTLNGIRTDLQNNSGSGLEVASGKVTFVGTNTVHAVGSATGTNTNRYTNENDWHYADAKMNVSVAENATFELGSHARLTGNVTVADSGTFVMREGVKHQYEYIEGGYTLEDTYAIRDFYGLKGDVSLGDGSTLKFEYSDGTTSENLYAGNIAGTGNVEVALGTSGATLVLSGENTFTGTKTLTSGTLVAESTASLGSIDADKDATKWLVEAAGVIASNDGANLISSIHTDSAGVFALTADVEEQLDLSNHLKLFLGARGKVNYGKSGTTTALTARDSDGDGDLEWLLGGGDGELVVNFVLSGANDLILGNQYGKGTVTLTNTANDFTGNIIFTGQVTLDFTDAAALGESTISLGYTNRVYASNGVSNIDGNSSGVLLLDKLFGSDFDLSNHKNLYLGSDSDTNFTGNITLADDDTTYRFGGTTGTLTVNTLLDDRNATPHNLLVDGQTYSGGKVILAQAATLTGTVNVIGYDSSKTALTEGDISLSFSADNALTNASSVTVKNGGIIDLAGTNQTFKSVFLETTGTIIDSSLSGKLSVEGGTLNGTLALSRLEKIGADTTLALGGNVAVAVIDVAAGTLNLSGNALYAETLVNVANGATFGIGANAMSGVANLSSGANATIDGGSVSGSVIAVGGGSSVLSGSGTVSGTIGAEVGSTLTLSSGTLTFTGTGMNEAGGTVSLQSSQLNIGSVENMNFGGTLSVDTDATIRSERYADNAVRTFSKINVASGKTLTVDEVTWNTIWNIGALTGEGNVTWNSDTNHNLTTRMVLAGEGNLSGKFVFNRNYVNANRPYQAYLELAHDKALANASSLTMSGEANSYVALAINSEDVHLQGLNGNAYAHMYAGASRTDANLTSVPASSRNATLTLTGSGDYTYAGTVAGDESNALSVMMNGTGTQTFSGTATFDDVGAKLGTLTLADATVFGDVAVGQGAVLNFNNFGSYSLDSGKTFSVLDSEVTGTATFNGTLHLNGGTLSFSGNALGTDYFALTLDGLSVAENQTTSLVLTDTSSLSVGTTYWLANQDWTNVIIEVGSWEYLSGAVAGTDEGLKLTVSSKDGFVVWNGTDTASAWTDSAFAQHSALATTDVAVFNNTAQNKNVTLNANSTVAGILFDNTDAYAISGPDYTISAGYLTKENSGSVAIDSGLNISGNLSVEAGTLSLNGTATAGTTTLAAGTTLAGTGMLTTNSLVLNFGETTFDGITASVIGSATRFQSTTKTETTLNLLNGATLDDRNAYYAVTGALNLNGDETTGGTLYVGGLRLSDGGDVQSQLNVGKNVHLIITGTDTGQAGSFALSHWGNGLSASNLSNTVTVAGKLTSNAIISNWDTSANLNVVSGGELNLLKGLIRDTQRTDDVTVRVESGATLNAAGGIQHSSLGVNLKEGSTLGGIASTSGGTATFTNNFILGTSSASMGSVTVDTDIKTVSDFILTENSGGTIDLAGTIAGLGETRINVTGSGNLILSGTTSVAGIDVSAGATLSLAGTLLVTNLSAALIENAGTVSVTDSAVFAFSGDAATLNAGISTQLFSVVGSGSVNGTIDRSDILWNGKGLAERTEFAYDASTGTVSLSGSAALNLTWNGEATGTWNKTDETFTVDGTESQTSAFYDLDNVTLATVDAAINLGSAVHIDSLRISENAILSGNSENTFSANSITVNVGKTLTLSGENAVYSLNEISLKTDATLALNAGTVNFSQDSLSNGTVSVLGGTVAFAPETTISGGTVSVAGGTAAFPSLTVSGGEFSASAGTANITTLAQTRGRTTLSGGTTTITSATLSGGEIEISGGETTITNLTASGGTLNLLGGTNTVELLSAANGTATISGTGTITASHRLQLNPGGNLIIGNVGEAGPTINTNQVHIHNSANSATTETLTINSGSITVTSTDKNQNTSSGVLIGHWKWGTGILTLNDGVLNAKNTYTMVSWDSEGTLNINGGEYNAYGIALGGDEGNESRGQRATVNLNGGRLNLGAGGITNNAPNANNKTFNFAGGTLGAFDSWTSSVAMNLSGAATIDTEDADSAGTGLEITLSGALSGTGSLTKTGTGTLTLSGVNTFNGGLLIEAGTFAANGSSGDNASVSALGQGSVSVASGATLELGGNISLYSTIENAGTVTIASGTIFDLNNLTPDGKVYTIISGDGGVEGWESLTSANFTHATNKDFRTSVDGGIYTVYLYHGALTWVGATDANGAGIWDVGTSANWTYDENGTATVSNFYNEDDVIFATDGAQVTVASGLTIAPANMTVNENVTFLGENYTIAPTGTVSVASDKTLSLDGTGTLSGILANSGTIAIGSKSTLGVSASSTALGTITGSGRIELPNTTLTDDTTFRDASTWTGTVAFTETLSEVKGTTLANYGNEQSTIVLNGLSGWLGDQNSTTAIAADLVLNANLVLTNGFGDGTLTIDGNLSGNGSFVFDKEGDALNQKFIFNGSVSLPSMSFSGSGSEGNKTFNGAVDLDSFSSNAGAVTFSGETTDIGTLTSGGNVNITAGTAAIGTLTQTAGTVSLSEGASLTFTTGTSVFSAGSCSLSGDLTIGENAVVWVKSGDAINYNDGADRMLTVQGALKLGTDATAETPSGVRWSLGSNNKLVLDGGAVYGAGDGNGYALDFFESNTVSITDSSEIAANLTLRGNGTVEFDVDSDVTLTISGNLVAPAWNMGSPSAFEKSGLGTIILSGEKSNGGNVIVSSGKLVARNAVLSGNISVNGGELEIALGSDETLTQASGQTFATTGTGKISVTSGTLALTGAVNLSNVIENAGTIALANTTTFALDNLSATNNVYTLISGAGTVSGWDELTTENFTQSGAAVSSLRKSASNYSVLVGAGTLTWVGDTNGAGTWNETDANWTVNNAGDKFVYASGDSVIFATESAQVSFAENANVNPANITVSESVTFSGTNYAIAPTGTVSVASDKTLSLDGTGTLSLASASALSGDGSISVSEGSVVEFTTASDGISASQISGTGMTKVALTNTWGNTISLGDSFTGTTHITAGYFTINGATFGNTLKLSDGAHFQLTGGSTVEFGKTLILDGTTQVHQNSSATFTFTAGSSVSGEGTYDRRGGGTLTFNGEVDLGGFTTGSDAGTVFAGTTTLDTATISQGTVTFSGATATIATLSQTGGTVNFTAGTNSVTTLNTTGTLNISGGTNTIDTLNISGGSATVSGGTTTVSDGTTVENATLTLSGGGGAASALRGTLTINNGGLVKLTGGDVTGYSGGATSIHTLTINSGGTLHINDSANQTFGNMNLMLNGGTISGETSDDTFDLFGNATTITALGGTDAENIVTSTISAGFNLRQNDSVITVEEFGVLSVTGPIGNGDRGNHNLIKRGAGTLDLSGSQNSATGVVSVEAGTLKIDSAGWGSKGNLGADFSQTKLVLKTGGVLDVTTAQNTNTEDVYGNGGSERGFSVTEGAGTYRYSGAGTSYITANSNDNQHIGLADGAELIFDVVNADATLEVSKIIASTTTTGTDTTTGALTKIGEGTLTLSGANLHSGGTTISAGTLNASGTALGAGKVSVASGATLALSGDVTLFSTIENAGTVNIADGTTFALDYLTPTNNVYTLISATGENVSGWDELTTENFTQSGAAVSSLRKSASNYSVLVGAGTLTWVGDTNGAGTWNETDANWTFDGGVSSVNFFDGDSVIFATADASASLANDVSVGTMTVSQNLKLSGAGTIALSAPGNLVFENASTISLGEGVTLDLGSSDGTLDLSKVEGSGTAKYTHTGDGSGSGLITSGLFSGTVDYVGNLNWDEHTSSIGHPATTTLRLSSREGQTDVLTVNSAWTTFRGNIDFVSDYKIVASSGADVQFNGTVDASGFSLTTEGSVVFAGTTILGGLTVSGGTTALTKAGTIELANANLTIADGASLSLAEGVILDLGLELNGTLNKNIIGAGTIVWGNSSAENNPHRATIELSENFTGTLEYSGRIRLNTADNFVKSLGGTTELVLNGVDIWTGTGGTSDTNGIYSLNVAVVTIGESEVSDHAGSHLYLGGTGVSFNGELNAEGKTVTLAGGTNSFAGTTTIGTLNISGGTTKLSGGATITTVENAGTLAITAATNSITTLNTTGTLNVSGGTNTIDALNISGGTATFSGTTETTITTLSHTGGTVNFTAGTNSVTTLSSTVQINQTGGTLSIAGGNAVTLHQEAGTLNLVGNVTLSGSGERQGLYARGIVNIGDGTTETHAVFSRLELGDSASDSDSGTTSITVNEEARLEITGETNTWANANNYKTNSIVIGEWQHETSLTVKGTLSAQNAEIGLGDIGGSITIDGTLAAKGLGQAVKTGGTFDLTLNDGAWLLLGESGIANVKTSGTATLNAGTVASFAEETTIAKDLVLNSATGTTFNTYRYVATGDGFYFHDHNNDVGSAITIDGVISGTGKLITAGNGILTLSGTNTYSGGTTVESGTLKITNAKALGAVSNTVTVNSGAVLDLNANMDGTEHKYLLSGGTLKATAETGSGKKQIAAGNNAIELTANSVVQADSDFGMISGGWGANQLNLNGHTLTKTGDATFFLSQTTVTAGTIRIEAGTVQTVTNGGNSDAIAANIVIFGGSGNLDIGSSEFGVGSLTLEVSDSYTEATLSGTGTLVIGGDGKITVKRAELAALSTVAETAYAYQVAADGGSATQAYYYQVASSDATFDDAWGTSTFTLSGWDTGYFVQSYENGLLTITVPEPSSFGMLTGLGALALVVSRRRRRK